jgi:DcmR-like sensory protein
MSYREHPKDNYNKQKALLRGVNETLDAIKESETGTHCLMVYPDIMTLRAIYSRFTKIQLEDKNEIVLILPYYETTDVVRLVLSGSNVYGNDITNNTVEYSGIDVSRYEKEGSLVIVDSLKGYFGSEAGQENNTSNKNMDFMTFLNVLLRHAERRGKDGVTVLADMGSFYLNNHNSSKELMRYEMSLPEKYYGKNLKGYCLYHQKDFERRFGREEQAQLLDCHSRNIMFMNAC